MTSRPRNSNEPLTKTSVVRDEPTQSLLKLADGDGNNNVLEIRVEVLAELLESTALK